MVMPAAPAPDRAGETASIGTLLDESVIDQPGKAQVTQRILLGPQMSEAEVRAALLGRYAVARERTGFTYHSQPTVVAIYAYESREHAAAGKSQWIGMLMKSPATPEPQISIGWSVGTPAPAATRFGLSATERRALFQRIVRAEDQARKQARQRFPEDGDPQEQMRDEVLRRLMAGIQAETGLSDAQLGEITQEGLRHQWPLPTGS